LTKKNTPAKPYEGAKCTEKERIMNKDNDFFKKLYDNYQIIPCNSDKTPAVGGSWLPYKEKKFDFEKLKRSSYFGLLTGLQGLEIVDIDNHFTDANDLFQFISDNFDLSGFPVIKTAGGGYHLYFKTPNPGGNKKLASRLNSKNRPETLVETRGNGGYVIAPGSPGYEIIQNNIFDLPELTENQRGELLEICQALNEYDSEPIPEPEQNTDNTEAPGTHFNESMEAMEKTAEILKNAGWKTRNNIHFTRPGKKKGISATLGKVKNKFYVFSSNAAPFEPFKSYSPFAVLAMLEHRGNFSEAAKELAKEYGTKQPAQKNNSKQPAKKNRRQILADIIKDWNLRFYYNELTKILQVTENGKEKDIKIIVGDIIDEMEANRGVKNISANKINEMLMSSRFCIIYNPVAEFFKNLPKWDGKDYFLELTKYIDFPADENPAFFARMLKKHLIRAVRCFYEPKFVNRIVLTVYGTQAIGKTFFIKWLVNYLSEIYNDESIDPHDKDSVLALARNLVLSLDELDTLNRKDLTALKSFISKGFINKRLPYGKAEERFNRIASLFGSTNRKDILTDTQNSRWIILKVENLKWEKYTKEIDPLQLWAQAIEIYKRNPKAGELSKKEQSERDKRNSSQYLEISTEREILLKYFQENEKATPRTATEIKILIEQKLNPQRVNIRQLSRELKRLFGEPEMERVNGRVGVFYRLQTSLEEPKRTFENFYEKDQDIPF